MFLQRLDQRVLAVATVAGAAVLYLLFVGQAGLHESVCAAIVVVLAAAYGYGAFRAAGRTLPLGAAAIREFVRGAAAIPADIVRVGRALLRAVRARPDGAVGVLDRQPFRRGDDDQAVGWRAVAGLGASLAPNGYFVDLAADGDALIHRLAPNEGPA